MAKVVVVLCLLFIAENLVSGQGNCDDATFEKECPGPPANASNNCSLLKIYIKCVEDNILNNIDCADTLKQAVNQSVETMKSDLDSMDCSVRSTQASPQRSCDETTLATACPTPAVTTSDYCSVMETYIKCIDDNILNNTACPDILKQTVKKSIDSAKAYLGSLGLDCSFGGTLASPQGSCNQKSIATACPTPTATANDYCSVSETYIKCIEDNIMNNAACPDTVKQYWTQSIDSVKGNGSSMGCSFGSTLASPQGSCDSTFTTACGTLNFTASGFCSESETYIKCVEDNLVNNAACPDALKQYGKQTIDIVKDYIGSLNCSVKSNLVSGQGNCDVTTLKKECPGPPADASDYCSRIETYFKCVNDNIIHNANCDDALQQSVKQDIEEMKGNLGSMGCSGGSTHASLQGNCDQTTLTTACPSPAVTDSDYCSVIQTYLKCVDDNILNNAACPDIVKQTVKQSVDAAKGVFGSLGCSVGNSGSIIPAPVLSLALCGTAYFLMIFK